jgi:hypothetical protein
MPVGNKSTFAGGKAYRTNALPRIEVHQFDWPIRQRV